MNYSSDGHAIREEIDIRASAERVYAALADAELRVKWWGAKGRFKTTQMESDLRVGGKWLMRGIGVGGKPFTIRGAYIEVVPPRLLAFTWIPSWQDDEIETLVRFELEQKDGMTRVRLTHSGLTERVRTQHQGWPEVLTWLRAYVEAAG